MGEGAEQKKHHLPHIIPVPAYKCLGAALPLKTLEAPLGNITGLGRQTRAHTAGSSGPIAESYLELPEADGDSGCRCEPFDDRAGDKIQQEAWVEGVTSCSISAHYTRLGAECGLQGPSPGGDLPWLGSLGIATS